MANWSERVAKFFKDHIWPFLTSYFGFSSILMYAVLTPLSYLPGQTERFAPAIEWLFNIYAAIGIPSAFVAYKMVKWRLAHPNTDEKGRGRRNSNIIGLGILIAVTEIVGYTFGFVESVLIDDNKADLFRKIPATMVAFYAFVYVIIPLVSSFYDLQMGEKDTLLALIYKYSKNRMHPKIQGAVQRFYRMVQIPV